MEFKKYGGLIKIFPENDEEILLCKNIFSLIGFPDYGKGVEDIMKNSDFFTTTKKSFYKIILPLYNREDLLHIIDGLR